MVEQAPALLLPDVERSDEASRIATEMRDARTLLKDEQLRGVDVSSLVAGGARLFAEDGKAAREDPAGVFALSTPVANLDYFVSHAWKSPRFAKYCALCCYLNLKAAIAAFLGVGLFCVWYGTLWFETLPSFFLLPEQPKFIDNVALRACNFAQILAPVAFCLTFFFGHHLLRRGEKAPFHSLGA